MNDIMEIAVVTPRLTPDLAGAFCDAYNANRPDRPITDPDEVNQPPGGAEALARAIMAVLDHVGAGYKAEQSMTGTWYLEITPLRRNRDPFRVRISNHPGKHPTAQKIEFRTYRRTRRRLEALLVRIGSAG